MFHLYFEYSELQNFYYKIRKLRTEINAINNVGIPKDTKSGFLDKIFNK